MNQKQEMKFKQICLPKRIVDFLKEQNGFRKFRKNTFSVTDVVNCKRNTFYKKNNVPRENIESVSELWSSVRGNLLHELSSAYSWNELEGEMKVCLCDGSEVTVCGRLDMYDHISKTIIDLKTVTDLKKKIEEGLIPLDSHVKQIQAYYTIFSKTIPIENLNLVYADNSDMINFEIPIVDVSLWIKNRVTNIKRVLNESNVPEGEVSSKCKFCRYQNMCIEDGNGISEKISL